MKKINVILILSLFTLFYSCGKESNLDVLKDKRDKLSSKVKDMQAEIKKLNEQIANLDTTKKDKVLELVNVQELGSGQFKNYIQAQGKTYSDNNITITTDMGGLVKGVYVEAGQYINKGKTIVQLDNSVVRNQIAELETGIALAKEVYKKRKRLWDQNIGSEIEYLQAKNNYESLVNKRATASTQLGKMAIKAPISGYIDDVQLRIGEMASPGYPVATIVNNNDMEVRVDLPETYLGQVKKGDEILVRIPSLDIERSAEVKSVGQTVNQFNRAFQVIAKIDNKDKKIKPNMLVEAKFTSKTFDDVITIPAKYLQESSKGYFVYIAENVNSDNTAKAVKRSIDIGESYGGSVVVTEGLKMGDFLIEEGYRNVLDGQEIEINSEKSTKADNEQGE